MGGEVLPTQTFVNRGSGLRAHETSFLVRSGEPGPSTHHECCGQEVPARVHDGYWVAGVGVGKVGKGAAGTPRVALWELWPPGEKPTDWPPGVLDLHWEGGMPRSRGSVNRDIWVQEEEGTLKIGSDEKQHPAGRKYSVPRRAGPEEAESSTHLPHRIPVLLGPS